MSQMPYCCPGCHQEIPNTCDFAKVVVFHLKNGGRISVWHKTCWEKAVENMK